MCVAFFGSIVVAQAPTPEGPAPLTESEKLDIQDLVVDWIADGDGRMLLEILRGDRVVFDSAIVVSGAVEIHGIVSGDPVTLTVPVDTSMARIATEKQEEVPCFEMPLTARAAYSSPFGLWYSSDPVNVLTRGKVVPFYERSTGVIAPNIEVAFSGTAVGKGNTTLCPFKEGDDLNFDYAHLRLTIDASNGFTVTDLVATGIMTKTVNGYEVIE